METRIEAICVGDELLDGRVRDRNAAHLGAFLAERGLTLRRVDVVPDDIEVIAAALDSKDCHLLVVSGGLGPTDDDVTRNAAAEWMGESLRLDRDALQAIRERFESRNRQFTENNRRQAMVPESAIVLPTEVGTAPGFRVNHRGKKVFFFPGVPREFAWYVEHVLGDALEAPATETARRRLFFHGIGESALATRLREVTAGLEDRGVSLAYRADYPLIELKVMGPPDATGEVADEIVEHARPWLVAEDDEPLPARLGRLLREAGTTITTAESCTAGGIAALITQVSGSSSWFQRGFVTYANEAKSEMLGVSEEILLRYGAVSAQTVCQMASGARREARSGYAVAVSGIAGPSGGTPDKPVGTVHFGLATPDGVWHRRVHYRLPDRQAIRDGTAYTALAMALWHLEDRMEAHSVTGPYTEDEVWSPGGIRIDEEE
jgi:nicotinamide-nucleotide amidase